MAAQLFTLFSAVILLGMQVFTADALDITVLQFERTWQCADICTMESGEYKHNIDDICVLLMGYNYVTANAMYAEAQIRQLSACGEHKVQLQDGTKPYTVLLCTLSGQTTGKICVTKGKRTKDIFTYNYDADTDTCSPLEEKKGVA